MKKKKHWMTRLWIHTCPLIKMAVCLGLLMFSLFRNRIFDISTDWLRTLVSVLCAVLGIAALIGLLLALLEADQLFWDRRDGKIAQKRRLGKKKLLAVEEILALARENDLIEIQADTPGGVVKLGPPRTASPALSTFFIRPTTSERPSMNGSRILKPPCGSLRPAGMCRSWPLTMSL